MRDAEHIAYHAINIALGSNYRAVHATREEHGSWTKAWENIRASGAVPADPERSFTELEKMGVKLLLQEDAEFPSLLREIPWPAHGIYVRGDISSASGKPGVAIVGTRKASASGKETARFFAQELGRKGCLIVSGLALGMDGAAHEGALQANAPTFAVVATGLDTVYPKYHAHLAEKILESGGALISEYPPGNPTMAYRFLERNRIVSGLCLGTLLVEAPKNSGSLATARFALEQNRAVFVIPGPVNHPNFSGSHQLIRAGAELVTSPADIMESLGIEADAKTGPETAPESGGTDAERSILKVLRTAQKPLEIDKIAELANLNIRVVNQTLSFLIIRNAIAELDNGYGIKN